MAGVRDWKQKLPLTLSGRKSELRDNHKVAILRIPDVRVIETIDVQLQPTISVNVHVRNETGRIVKCTIRSTTN